MNQYSAMAPNYFVQLTEDEAAYLDGIIRKRTSPQHLVLRANIISMANHGVNFSKTSRLLRTTVNTVKLWRKRWNKRRDLPLTDKLVDNPRTGAPATFTPEQICAIIALACEKPEKYGRPITHWTNRELADEAIKQGIVDAISPRSAGRFLKSGRCKTTSISVLAKSEIR